MSLPVVYGASVPLDDHSRDALAAKTLDEDLATLLALGLNLKDVERLWRQNKVVDMSDVYASATRVLGGAQPGLPVKREVTVGLEVAGSGTAGAEVLPELAELLRNELDEPPEHFRDPIMLTLMRDPVVISSGHVLDRSTVYDGARFRLQSCPMTRQHIDQTAFPLVYLKAQLIDFKLKRLDGILAAVQANIPPSEEPTRVALITLLELAAELFEGLAASAAAAAQTYHHRAATFFSCRKQLAPPADLPPLLTELAAASSSTSAAASEPRWGGGGVPPRIIARGAGFGAANGVYTRTGEYRNATGDAAPLFIHEAGQIWLLRYRLPSGTDWWYVADKDQLDRNDGDYYRVRADPEARDVPPLDGWARVFDGVEPPPSFAFADVVVGGAAMPGGGVSAPPPEARPGSGGGGGFFRRMMSGLRPSSAAPSVPVPSTNPMALASGGGGATGAMATGWEAVADRDAPLAQLLAAEFGAEASAALLDAALPPSMAGGGGGGAVAPLVFTLRAVRASDADHARHNWGRFELPNGWAALYSGGSLAVRWKDQGWGNQKGHIWARLEDGPDNEWRRISTSVAPHAWSEQTFDLPAAWFDAPIPSVFLTTLELAYEVGGGGGHELFVQQGATLRLQPRAGAVAAASAASSSATTAGAAAAAAAAAAVGGGSGPRMGDCLEVQDTHGLWAVARVIEAVDDAALGPLCLVHFEGWSASWLMWIHRTHDAERVRPLGATHGGARTGDGQVRLPGIGSRGAHTAASLRAIVQEAFARLREPATRWPATGGSSYRTYPFRVQGRNADSFMLSGGYQPQPLPAQLPFELEVPHFHSCHEVAADRERAAEMHRRFGVA